MPPRAAVVAVTLAAGLWSLLAAAPAGAAKGDVHGAPLPKGAKPLGENHYRSPQGFRDTVEFYRKELQRRGVEAEVHPTEKRRDVVYTRILPRDPAAASWSAIHIVLAEGKTTIYIVPPKIGDKEGPPSSGIV